MFCCWRQFSRWLEWSLESRKRLRTLLPPNWWRKSSTAWLSERWLRSTLSETLPPASVSECFGVPRLRPWHLAFPVCCSCSISCSSSESVDDYRSLIKATDLPRQFRQARMVARAVKSRCGNPKPSKRHQEREESDIRPLSKNLFGASPRTSFVGAAPAAPTSCAVSTCVDPVLPRTVCSRADQPNLSKI